MSLGIMSLSLFLIAFAISSFGWVAVSNIALGILALIAGLFLIFAEMEVYPRKRL